jgi:two-component system, chemotaxis family, CheB/CheR fusion protein
MEQETTHFSHLVVVGSSAGGIEALSTLVSTLPSTFAAPLVIAQHLDPRRTSRLGEILARHSTLPVRTVAEVESLEPGVVYVVPADRDIEITDHEIRLSSSDSSRHPKPSIDRLLSSAAEQFGEALIAVILTGTGSDGAAGARAVHTLGGTVVIQDPQSASYPALPLSLAPSTVDIVSELKTIGPLLNDLVTGAYARMRPEEDRVLRSFLEDLRERSGIDFSSYKTPTIQRRLQRRLAATGVPDLEQYVRYLQRHPDEYQRLVSSFLIKVTEFFRDPQLFDYLREKLLPELTKTAREQHSNELRIWSAGCATGEEAYSLSILVADVLSDDLPDFNVRIFATDVDADAIAFARRGVYPASALGDVPPPLMERYFSEIEGAYEVKKLIRGMTVFGQHDLGQRAPFPRIDLALCRNVLIYFTPELQRRALHLFAFSLREGGYLILGKSETTSPLAEYFVLEEPHLKAYRRQGERALIPLGRIKDTAPLMPLRIGVRQPTPTIAELPRRHEGDRARQQRERAESLLLHLPLGVVIVDRRYDIENINVAARRLLGIHGPAVGDDLIHLTQGVPSAPLRTAVDETFRSARQVETDVLESSLPDGQRQFLRVVVYPEPNDQVAEGRPETAVVLVLDATPVTERRLDLEAQLRQNEAEQTRASEQAQRLNEVNQHLLDANQELSTANAELRSVNEELLVANEEAQAATEEVETLNEELQATNEELETLNEELQATVEELNTTNDDLQSRSIELQDLALTLEDQRRTSEAERARLQAVLASMAEPVVLVDNTGTPIVTNDSFDHIFGSGVRQLLDPRGEPLEEEATPQQRAARGETFRMRFSMEDEVGTRRCYEASGQPIHSSNNQQGGVVVMREVTER